MEKLKYAVCVAVLVAALSALFMVVLDQDAWAKEWRAGVSVTVPLGMRDILERGTLTTSFEVYDAEQVNIYSAIDNSVTTIDRSRTTTNKTNVKIKQTTVNNNNSVNVSGIHNNVHVR